MRRVTTSLNGGTTKPLTAHGWAALERLARGPVPCIEFNAGIVDRLTRPPDPLAKVVDLPSPYKAHKGGDCPHLMLTEVGERVWKDRPAMPTTERPR